MLLSRPLSALFRPGAKDWRYLLDEAPEIAEMERFFRDLSKKETLFAEIQRLAIHERSKPFAELRRLIEEENLALLAKMMRLRRTCRTAHVVAQVRGHTRLRWALSAVDCESFWKDWPVLVQTQYEFFERSEENVWLESISLDRLGALIRKESKLLAGPRTILRAMPREAMPQEATIPVTAQEKREERTDVPAVPAPPPQATPTAPPEEKPKGLVLTERASVPKEKDTALPQQPASGAASATAQPDPIEGMWQYFKRISKTGEWHCKCSIATGRCCMEGDETMLRLLSQELHVGRLDEEDVHHRFTELIQGALRHVTQRDGKSRKYFPCLGETQAAAVA